MRTCSGFITPGRETVVIMESMEIEAEGQSFEALLADGLFDHFRGMRFRRSGKMLFRFYRASRPRIDMLFVPKTLYLYFLDSDKRVVDVQKAEPWRLNPGTWRFYRPAKRSKYLLESFRPVDLEQGDRLDFTV